MDIRQCRRCRKLFQYIGNPQCPACVQELDNIFNKVRNYLYDNPRASIEQICDDCGAEESNILGWLREGRLILNDHSAGILPCEGCGASIASGRYCDACAKRVKSDLQSTAQSMAPGSQNPNRPREDNTNPRMRVNFHR